MPLEEGVLIACKDGVVELTATVTEPHRDSPQVFGEEVAARILEHQYQAMTDPAILNPDNLAIATSLVSRDPLPVPIRDVLISLGFAPVDTETGASEERSMFARFQQRRRSKLDKWRVMYLRASDVSPRLAELEELILEELPRGSYPEISEAAAGVVVDAARTALRLLIEPSFESLGRLEKVLLAERASKKGRMVLHPAAVRALSCFVAEVLIRAAPATRWSEEPDDDAPLWVEARRGTSGEQALGAGSPGVIRTDPEFRVVNFVAKGSKEMLSSYVESVLRQSLTAASQT